MAAFLLALEIACFICLVPCQPCAGEGQRAAVAAAEPFCQGFPAIVAARRDGAGQDGEDQEVPRRGGVAAGAPFRLLRASC